MRAGLQHEEPDRRIDADNRNHTEEASGSLERPPDVEHASILVHDARRVGQGLAGEHRAVRAVLVAHENWCDDEADEGEEDVAGEAVGQVETAPRVRLHDAQIRVGAYLTPETSGTPG